MGDKDTIELSLADYASSPERENKSEYSSSEPTSQIDSRDHQKGHRRQLVDRRNMIRFDDNRRSGTDRRSSNNQWDNLHSY